jgi:biotin-(acetyl-CoA carboxylase) ligase
MRTDVDESVRTSATSIQQAIDAYRASMPSVPVARPISRESVLISLLTNYESLSKLSFDGILLEYARYDMLVGQTIIVMPRKKEDAASFYEARAKGFSEEGYLIVVNGKGETVELVAEEVTVRPAAKK